jgi:hypothetical protein
VVDQIEDPSRFRRIVSGHGDVSGLDQLVDGLRAEVDLGPGLGRQLKNYIRVSRIGGGVVDELGDRAALVQPGTG